MSHQKQLKIVGMDPSQRNWGIAKGTVDIDTGQLLITDLQTIKTEAQPKGGRVRGSTWDIESAALLYEGAYLACVDADIICVEVPTGAQNNKGATAYGMCLGILGTLYSNKVILVTPQSVKKIIGKKDASKADSVALAASKHPEAPWPMWRGKISVEKAEHSADAINAIYAASQTPQFKQLISEYKHANQVQETN